MEDYKTGLGFDLHKITKKRKYLVLGGYRIACGFGLEAVSDGDVILHAVCDAICGAACLGDIGDYFRPRAKKSKNIKSEKIASFLLGKITGRYKLINIDITLVADKPRLFSHKRYITKSLKKIFEIDDINLKIKSKEKTQSLGGIDVINCFSVVLLKKINPNDKSL